MIDGWYVYLKDPLDPEDDVFLAGPFESESNADSFVRDHAREYGNDDESYAIEHGDVF